MGPTVCLEREACDLHVKKRIMKEGGEVYTRNFYQGPKWMPGLVQQSNGPTSFEVELEDGRKWKRHPDHLIHRESCPQMLTEAPAELPENPLPQPDEAETKMTLTAKKSRHLRCPWLQMSPKAWMLARGISQSEITLFLNI